MKNIHPIQSRVTIQKKPGLSVPEGSHGHGVVASPAHPTAGMRVSSIPVKQGILWKSWIAAAFLVPVCVRGEIVISEVLSHSDPPFEDAIELQNVGSTAIDISSWWLSDSSKEPYKYRIPAGTVVEPGGYRVFYQGQFGVGATGFQLNSSEGDEVHVTAADVNGFPTGFSTSETLGALKTGVSVGRVVTADGPRFLPLSSKTFGVDQPSSVPEFRTGSGKANSPARIGPVVISEIMFDPTSGGGGLSEEFVELHNTTSSAVPLYDSRYPTNTYRIADGITFRFPLLQTLPPGGHAVVVSFDPVADPSRAAAFRMAWAMPAEALLVGPFSGRLNNTGERIVLRWPDEPQGPDRADAGFVPYEDLDEVTYSVNAPWPTGARENGKTLQRNGFTIPGADAVAWTVSNATPGRSLPITPNPDADTDGMADVWETQNGLDPTKSSDALEDADGDGFNNLAEYTAATDPRDPLSLLRIQSIVKVSESWVVQFLGGSARQFVLESAEDSGTGIWQRLDVPSEPVDTGTRRFVIPESAAPKLFLRVTASLPSDSPIVP